jgi:hypothetical protein
MLTWVFTFAGLMEILYGSSIFDNNAWEQYYEQYGESPTCEFMLDTIQSVTC